MVNSSRNLSVYYKKKVFMLQNQAIEQVKVHWKDFGRNEATWEMADQMKTMYPSLFSD